MHKKGETGGFSIVETYVDTIATQIYYKPDKFFKCLNSTNKASDGMNMVGYTSVDTGCPILLGPLSF